MRRERESGGAIPAPGAASGRSPNAAEGPLGTGTGGQGREGGVFGSLRYRLLNGSGGAGLAGKVRAALGARLAYNLMWSFLGTVLPMIAAVVAIPHLIGAMGLARFGLLSLAWIVVGYFSLFDLGLGRAMTQLVALSIGKGREDDIPAIVRTGMGLMVGLGMVGGLALALASQWFVHGRLAIPAELRAETLTAFYLLAFSVPLVIATTGLRGLLEARQRFDIVNIVRIPLGVLTYLGPLAVLPFSNELPATVAALVAIRAASFLAYLAVCLKLYPELRRPAARRPDLMVSLLTFGGWLTLSNIAGPVLLYLGRVLLVAIVSAEAVAYFSTPYDVVVNLLIFPGILVSVYFPVLTQAFASDRGKAKRLYCQASMLNVLAMMPLSLGALVLAKPALALWLGPEFAEKSYRVAQLIALGVFINSFGHISQALVQAYGRPDLTAQLHVAELLTYIPYLWWLVKWQSIDGAAMAWVIRVTISTLALGLMAHWCLTGRIDKESRTVE